ncbi:protoporphyrinogen oxidase [Geobacter sp. OR-1]|uniref:protoporphyrinogen oxidase n=1 Tax=Geobacter sp. OR-1 TaxID=1266765 RepID=UPI00054221C4|nr:protoporphyrinogen oxidase [Geobacter sp. OR-1]GAM08557.1 protoporphyrinogen oxidase [Geobacter sp. OR-1]
MKRAIVVGGGISGLATACLLQEKAGEAGIDLEVILLEKEKRTGGKIWSIKEQGFLCEWGPNGFLDNKPQTLELCRRVGADSKLLRSNDNARKRFIFSEGVLHKLPENGPSFLSSKLISWPGKLRLAMEPLIPQYRSGEDESLAAFGRRRLGDEALRKLIAPMVSGIFAGDPETMSLKSCFPRIAELEAEYGGLIKAMIRLAKKKKQDIAEGKVVASAAGPGGVLTSFRGGIQDLTDILSERIGKGAITLDEQVERVEKGCSAPFRVCSDRGELDADLVILATPAYATAGMLQGLNPGLTSLLHEIPYATMTVVCFGYQRERISRDLDGFGYLIPKQEGKSILGTLWDSSIFENRAPEGHVLLRSMMGGACFPQYVTLPDEEVQKRVQADLKTIMGISEPPDFVRIFRHEKAIPQYTVGHAKRLAGLEEQVKAHPGLILTGNSYRGIGLNDCVAAAQRASDEAICHLQAR